MADGTLIFDTKVDTSGIKKGMIAIQRFQKPAVKLQRLAKQLRQVLRLQVLRLWD